MESSSEENEAENSGEDDDFEKEVAVKTINDVHRRTDQDDVFLVPESQASKMDVAGEFPSAWFEPLTDWNHILAFYLFLNLSRSFGWKSSTCHARKRWCCRPFSRFANVSTKEHTFKLHANI